MNCSNLANISCLLIDLDGVVYRGKELLPGAREFFDFVSARQYSYALLTNNSTATRSQYAQRLATVGINVPESAIFTSGEAVARYLSKRAPRGAKVYIIGEDGLRQPVLQAGFMVDETAPQYVLVGLDRHFNYDAMAKACVAVRRGATLIASNPDKTFPVERGVILPGAGAIVSSIVACTDERPIVIGKPNKEMLLLAIEQLGANKRQTAMIGDRLDTDVLAGKRAGVCTILLLTGVTSQDDLARSRMKPDYVFRDLSHLIAAFEEATLANLPIGEMIEPDQAM